MQDGSNNFKAMATASALKETWAELEIRYWNIHELGLKHDLGCVRLTVFVRVCVVFFYLWVLRAQYVLYTLKAKVNHSQSNLSLARRKILSVLRAQYVLYMLKAKVNHAQNYLSRARRRRRILSVLTAQYVQYVLYTLKAKVNHSQNNLSRYQAQIPPARATLSLVWLDVIASIIGCFRKNRPSRFSKKVTVWKFFWKSWRVYLNPWFWSNTNMKH